MKRATKLVLPVILAIVLSACGGGFAQELRVILAASGPLLDSLNLGDKKQALVTDFIDLSNGAATLKVALDGCANTPCKLTAVESYDSTFESVVARGHFGVSPRLTQIESIVRGIIASARIYYGGEADAAKPRSVRPATVGHAAQTPAQAKASLEKGLNDLRAAMAVK